MRIGTRGSKLAMIQTHMVSEKLKNVNVKAAIAEVPSHGDVDRESPIYSMGKVGVFVDRLNRMIIDGGIDCAVHSAKDIPSVLDSRLEISAVLKREDPRDAFVSAMSMEEIGAHSVIGTSSLRRIKGLQSIRDDLEYRDIRGNIDTRLDKLGSGQYDGIIVAAAALVRMGVRVPYHLIDTLAIVPAPNQGIIAVVSEKGSETSHMLESISHRETMEELQVERRVMTSLSLGCSEPVGIIAKHRGGRVELNARFYNKNGPGFFDFSTEISSGDDIATFISDIRTGMPGGYGYSL